MALDVPRARGAAAVHPEAPPTLSADEAWPLRLVAFGPRECVPGRSRRPARRGTRRKAPPQTFAFLDPRMLVLVTRVRRHEVNAPSCSELPSCWPPAARAPDQEMPMAARRPVNRLRRSSSSSNISINNNSNDSGHININNNVDNNSNRLVCSSCMNSNGNNSISNISIINNNNISSNSITNNISSSSSSIAFLASVLILIILVVDVVLVIITLLIAHT